MEMAGVAVRYALGYLIQVAPCAALCLLPFADALRVSPKRTAVHACVALAASCAVFVIVCLSVFDSYEDARIMMGNLLFLVLLSALLPLFWREVTAGRSCKTFVFLTSAVIGSIVTVTAYSLNAPLGLPDRWDGRLYAPPKLAVIAAVDVVVFLLGWLLMRRGVRPLVEAGIDERRWRSLCIIPLATLVLVVGAYWLPMRLFDADGIAVSLAAVLVVLAAAASTVAFVIVLRDLGKMVRERDGLVERAATLERERDEISGRVETLRREREEAERKAAEDADTTRAQVTFETPAKTLKLAVADILYMEVFGHRLVLHLTDGAVEHLGMSLTQALALVPEDAFVHCHRSYAVRRGAVRAIRRYELVLSDGESVPVSKQRYRKVEESFRQSAEHRLR